MADMVRASISIPKEDILMTDTALASRRLQEHLKHVPTILPPMPTPVMFLISAHSVGGVMLVVCLAAAAQQQMNSYPQETAAYASGRSSYGTGVDSYGQQQQYSYDSSSYGTAYTADSQTSTGEWEDFL